ncbi:MAG: hypothetical protein ACREVN_02915 [Gammaproteobacteria bacterium]
MNESHLEAGGPGAGPIPRRLESWKRIAQYLNRDVRTVQRWEAAEGLPVHRLQHRSQGSVFAYVEELDAWLNARASDGAVSHAPSARRRTIVAGLIVAMALATAAALWFGSISSDSGVPGDRLMLAVLPFENLSGETARSYFSDGLTEDVITELGHVNPERLGVIARTSVMQYRGSTKDIAEIGRELGVDYILEGSVRRDGERLRLAAQLIDASDQSHRWAQTYDRSLHSVLDLQTELARQVARAIRIELGTAYAATGKPAATNLEAYELLLLGKHHLYRWMPDGFVLARRYLSQAIERDPGLAAAHAWLAMAHLAIAFYEIEPRAEAYAGAVQAARRALELNPREGQALVVLAFKAHKYDWDWHRAEQLFQRALEVGPNSPWPHWGYAHLLNSQGRHEEAIAEARLALRLDPASLFMHFVVQSTLWDARRYDEAFAACQAAQERLPERPRAYFQCAKEVYERMGQYERAIGMRARLSELGAAAGYYYKIEAGNRDIGPLRRLYSEHGPSGYWAWVKELRDELGDYHAVNRAIARAQRGELDEAIAVLNNGFRRRDHSMTQIKVEPLLDPLRGDPRFRDLLRQMHLQD